ncbi:MAG TPA: LuxR C-terminal-related transcriptional regulator [Polyangiaceae bacterium]|nr:LuxR C-terminal-related transcriptional regulator [Polyangiaceae bacterium]
MRIDHFITQIRVASDVGGVRDIMSQAATSLGLGGFLYLSRRERGLPTQLSEQTVITSFPAEWTARHLARDSRWSGRILARAGADELPFFWGEPEGADPNPPDRPSQELRLAAGPGADHGWTVPIHDPLCGVAALSFTGAQGFGALWRAVETHRATLHVMAIYFHARARKALAARGCAPAVGLTPRELQCLGWAALGKSRTDIGQIIGVSPRTIKFHLENAQRKLNVAHTTQAVLRAAQLGLIVTTEEL